MRVRSLGGGARRPIDAGVTLEHVVSQRLTLVEEPDPDAPLLDAARECVLAVGVRRTTFSDVARRAGVSRMTLYRRFGDLEALLAALMTREFGRLVAASREQAAKLGTTRERIVA